MTVFSSPFIPLKQDKGSEIHSSKDDKKLSETEVKTWVDNYKSSLRKKQTGKETDPKDKDQE
jgi:hypothetical protein